MEFAADSFTPPPFLFFFFLLYVIALQFAMGRLADTSLVGGERADATDHCLAGISRLSNEVKDASSYIPTYDQRIYAEVSGPVTQNGLALTSLTLSLFFFFFFLVPASELLGSDATKCYLGILMVDNRSRPPITEQYPCLSSGTMY